METLDIVLVLWRWLMILLQKKINLVRLKQKPLLCLTASQIFIFLVVYQLLLWTVFNLPPWKRVSNVNQQIEQYLNTEVLSPFSFILDLGLSFLRFHPGWHSSFSVFLARTVKGLYWSYLRHSLQCKVLETKNNLTSNFP